MLNKTYICMPPELALLSSPAWTDYELLDSGNGRKLERFGPNILIRPEHQAIWRESLSAVKWQEAQAVFRAAGGDEMGGNWQARQPIDPWEMHYKRLRFRAQLGGSRHVGVFPEQATHWDWIGNLIRTANRPVSILNLFGYTGLATLAAASEGARVTHVDASKKSVARARENQALSRLDDRNIRWIVDDAMKFVTREARRQIQYDGIILDPPKFGRGPKGEVWECFEMLPRLLESCRVILSSQPLFVVITAYAIRASALSLYYALDEIMKGKKGNIEAGELVIVERSAERVLSMAIFARWGSG
jgi:23S rRNA (cytosine1962-C5)-methyltransferase